MPRARTLDRNSPAGTLLLITLAIEPCGQNDVRHYIEENWVDLDWREQAKGWQELDKLGYVSCCWTRQRGLTVASTAEGKAWARACARDVEAVRGIRAYNRYNEELDWMLRFDHRRRKA